MGGEAALQLEALVVQPPVVGVRQPGRSQNGLEPGRGPIPLAGWAAVAHDDAVRRELG